MQSVSQRPATGKKAPPPALIDGVSQQQIDDAVKAHVRKERAQRRAVVFVGDDIKFFRFGESDVRVVMRDGDPWFVAVDVCAALKIANSRDALLKLDADEKGVGLTDTLGGKQEVAIISESGMYTLVLRCRDAVKPGTTPHQFRKWVTGEVLPSIRKTGGYGSLPSIDVERLMTQDLPVPSVPLPLEVEDAIENKAWEMGREAYKLSLLHLRRYVAHRSESGWPRDKVSVEGALKAVAETNLGTALTQKRRRVLNYLDGAISVKCAFVPEINDVIERLIGQEEGAA